MNVIMLKGKVSKNPQHIQTKFGGMTRFQLSFNFGKGKWGYVNVIANGHVKLSKHDQIVIYGSLQYQTYKKNDGTKVYEVLIKANKLFKEVE